ncbi:MAG: helix-turn-helix domain-containing protein [Acidimicrobiales bacterium]|jgi:excisionase family DNA binding protein
MTAGLTIGDLQGRDVCTVEELSQVLGLSRGATYAAVRAGELPALRVGGRWIVPVRQIAALLGADGEGAS